MSLIYKSLRQLKKEEETKRRRRKVKAPEAVAPGMKKIVLKFLLYISSVILFVFITMFWLRSEIRQIVALTAKEIRGGKVEAVSAEKPKKQTVETKKVLANKLPEIKKVEARELPPLQKKKVRKSRKIAELKGPTLALERHFSRVAKTNQVVLELQSRLVTNVSSGKIDEVKKEIQIISRKLGKKSFYTLKWQGYLALKENNYNKAEALYRQALAINPLDKEARINLALALLGQGKKKEAEKIYKQLRSEYPEDEVVARLGKAF